MRHFFTTRSPLFFMILIVLILAGVYAATLQTQISGSFQESTSASILKNEYIKDVAEIQVALNVWGTIHHTGYPLFALLGNIFTLPFRWLGIEPATAASLYALTWGAIMLGGFGVIFWRLTGHPVLAVLGAGLLGVTRTIWIHHVIAEVYSMSLAITVLMLLIGLWPAAWEGRWSVQRRVLWLALLGGIGVAHHRAVAFVAPGLLLAVGPRLWQIRDQWRRLIPAAVGLGVVGFLPYFYLPLRARQNAVWVYGEPGTLRGFWVEFSGREADRLVKLPADLAGLWDNIRSVADILIHELTLPGLVLGVVCLGLAMLIGERRHAARIVGLSAAGPTLFAVFYHTAVLPEAVLMPTVLALVFGVILMVDWLRRSGRAVEISALIGIAIWGGVLVGWHYAYIHDLVTEPSGVQTIERIERLPRSEDEQTALMLPWGPRYAAAMYAKLVTGKFDDLLIVDHKADYRKLLNNGYRLYTEPETFYTYAPPWPTAYGPPSDWWTERIGPITLTSAAPGYVQILNTPWLAAADDPPGETVLDGIMRRAAWLTCDAAHIYLTVIWGADTRPTADPSIFVHLTPDEPIPNPPSADSRHPVYGLYPFTEWSPAEIVRDDYTLPRLTGMTYVRFGLYEQDESGQFVNYGEQLLPVAECEAIGD